MYALTIWQPYAWAIAEGIKLIENRDYPPPAALVGQTLAIHAGKSSLAQEAAAVFRSGVFGEAAQAIPEWNQLAFGAVVAVAELAGFCEPHGEPDRPWWNRDAYGWRLCNVRKLPEPVPCRGYQRVWQLRPPAVVSAVRAQVPA
jgi:hypothetical protein